MILFDKNCLFRTLQYTLMSQAAIASIPSVEISIADKLNQPIEAEDQIKPFRSYRQPRLESDTSPAADQNSGQTQPYKLLRQYPTDSVQMENAENKPKQLKFKYDVDKVAKEIMQSEQKKAEREPLASSNQPLVGESYKYKKSLNSIRKNTVNSEYPFHTSSHRQEVQSIIFDSKVDRFESFDEKYLRGVVLPEPADKNLLYFKQKVNRVNSEIEAGLNNIENMIKELKKQKVAQSMIDMQKKISLQLQEKEREQERDRERDRERVNVELLAREVEVEEMRKRRERQERQERELQQQAERKAKMEKERLERQEKDRLQKTERERLEKELFERQQREMQQLLNKNKAKMPTTKPVEEQIDVKDSQIELVGDFKNKSPNFPPEYTTFINRLTTQIQIDMEFTDMVSELTKSQQMQAIKQIIFTEMAKYKQSGEVNQSFFQMEPSELDALQQVKPGKPKPLSEDQQREEAMKLYKKYKEIESHFSLKLKGRFEQPILRLLFDELSKFNFTKSNLEDSDSVTVGHLLSYVNMRTNRSFRNRFFVKMLKRLNLKSTSFLTMQAMKVFVSA